MLLGFGLETVGYKTKKTQEKKMKIFFSLSSPHLEALDTKSDLRTELHF